MASVKAFSLEGYDLYFHSREHDPPHFHLSKNGENWEVKIQYMTCTIEFLDWIPSIPKVVAKDFSPFKGEKKKKKELLKQISIHREEIIAQWQERTGGI